MLHKVPVFVFATALVACLGITDQAEARCCARGAGRSGGCGLFSRLRARCSRAAPAAYAQSCPGCSHCTSCPASAGVSAPCPSGCGCSGSVATFNVTPRPEWVSSPYGPATLIDCHPAGFGWDCRVGG
jgi:hypothetical protein